MIRVLTLLLTALGSTNFVFSKDPSWLVPPYKPYNTNKFELAVGIGSTLTQAESSAYETLSKIFGITIDINTKMKENIKESFNTVDYKNELINDTLITGTHKLFTTKREDYYYDKKEDCYYVLLSLDKVKTRALLTQKINANNKGVDKYMGKIPLIKDPLMTYAYLQSAYELVSQNEVYQDQIFILNNKNQFPKNKYPLVDLEFQIKETLKNVSFSISKDIPKELMPAILKSLLSQNMAHSSTPYYIIKGTYSDNVQKPPYGIDILNYHLQLDLVDKKDTILTTIIIEGKAGASTNKELKQNAFKILQQQIEELLPQHIERYLENKII